MINATDLTTIEVRTQYVQPLIKGILTKTNLTAAALGIHSYEKSSTTATDEAEPMSSERDAEEGIISTLYQEIALYRGETEVDDINSNNIRSYAEILEEASALSAYLTHKEQTLVATVASAAFVSFLFPHCDYLRFLHSYFASVHHIETLDERLTNAIICNQDSSVFPYSASQMTSIGESAFFYRFLHQGLTSYFSCGMAFCSNNAVIRNQACNDVIQLIAMAICQSATQNDVTMMFQLPHPDRLQILQVCKTLALKNQTALSQLRQALFGFASNVAQSDKEAADACEALVNVCLIENDESIIQFEFQRMLQTLVETKSSFIIHSTSICLQEMILKYKGNKTQFYCFAVPLLANAFDAEIDSAKNAKISMDNTFSSDTENVAKRQKLSPDNCKTLRLVEILKTAGVLFSSLSSGTFQDVAVRELKTEAIASTKQMIQNATVLLQCPADVVCSASAFLAAVLSYETAYLNDKSNVKKFFTHVRQSLLSLNSGKAHDDIIGALKPIIVTCSKQSATFAVSFLSFAIKTYSSRERLFWKLVTFVSTGNSFAASKRLRDLDINSKSDDEEVSTYKIRTLLSCTCGTAVGESPSDNLQRCLSLAESISDKWILFKLVRVGFQMSNYPFARAILEKRLVNECSRRQSFLWLSALSKLAHGEEVLTSHGAKGIPKSLELLSSCSSILTSLSALERDGKFNFQLEYIRLRMDTLNLFTIARSQCVEVLATEGTLSGKNNRSNYFRKNIAKSVGLLVSRYEKMYRLWGLHRCHQPRSTLRSLQAMCQLVSDFANHGIKERKSRGSLVSTPTRKSTQMYDQNPMDMMLSKLRSDVLEQMKSPKQKDDSVSQASGLLFVLDAILKHPGPFPSGFFQTKPIPQAVVNISADPNVLQSKISHDVVVDAKSGTEIIDVISGLETKVILSGVIPEEFTQDANICFSEIMAWATVKYEGRLYEEDNALDGHVSDNIWKGVTADVEPNGPVALLPGGKFIMSIPIESLLQEGYYKVSIDLGCRDVRGGMWIIPTTIPLEVILRFDDE